MTVLANTPAAPPVPLDPAAGDEYRPGVCNIGPAEISRRRRAGHGGLLVTLVLFGLLVELHVQSLARFLVALPAAAAATGYLQATLRFCVGFASRGIFNFGQLGQAEQVVDPEALARDRRRANQILLASLAIGLVAGGIAVVLPL
jgi:hypothetical protein